MCSRLLIISKHTLCNECTSIYGSYIHICCDIGMEQQATLYVSKHACFLQNLVYLDFVFWFFGCSFTSLFWYMRNFNDILMLHSSSNIFSVFRYYPTPHISKLFVLLPLYEKTMVMSVTDRTRIFSVNLIQFHLPRKSITKHF